MPGVISASKVAAENRERQRANRNDFLSMPEPEEDHKFEVDLRGLSYRELQKLAKSRNISAGGSKVNLYARLAEA